MLPLVHARSRHILERLKELVSKIALLSGAGPSRSAHTAPYPTLPPLPPAAPHLPPTPRPTPTPTHTHTHIHPPPPQTHTTQDYGTIPKNAWELGVENFRRELRALRRAVRFNELAAVEGEAGEAMAGPGYRASFSVARGISRCGAASCRCLPLLGRWSLQAA